MVDESAPQRARGFTSLAAEKSPSKASASRIRNARINSKLAASTNEDSRSVVEPKSASNNRVRGTRGQISKPTLSTPCNCRGDEASTGVAADCARAKSPGTNSKLENILFTRELAHRWNGTGGECQLGAI